ncbi:hypothetical protein E2C11_29030 [Streptomyces lavendulae]|nr:MULTISPECIES: hypothetical protein [Streptomyces]TXJ73558.1 hypothetical protein E2C11_29030 [Streptomyces lavendulae]
MNTARRPLGRGPTTGLSMSSDSTSPRLLPVERAVATSPMDVSIEDQAVVQPRGRRGLGHGPTGAVSPGATGAATTMP